MSEKPTGKPHWLQPHGPPWTPGTERVAFESGWIRVTDQMAIAPTGRPAPYGLVRFKNLAVAVLPIHEDGTVTLVGQHRFPLGDYSWELPEGGSPLDEDPLDGAKRELARYLQLGGTRGQIESVRGFVFRALFFVFFVHDCHETSERTEKPIGQGRRDSNSRPVDLESTALPTELHP